MELIVFKNCQNMQSSRVTLEQVVAQIKSTSLREPTMEVRHAMEHNDMRRVKRLKTESFPAMMPACYCREGCRQLEDVVGLTGICQADFDHLDDDQLREARQRLQSDPYVLLLYTSMSGHGLHVLYRWDVTAAYTQAFRQGNEYLARVACAGYDPSVESPVHLSNLSYDPEAYYNPEARTFRIDESITLNKRGQRNPVTRPRPQATPTWDDGWNEPEVCDYARELRDRHDCYTEGNRHNYLVALAFLLSSYGVSEQCATGYLERTYPDYRDEDIARLVGDCYRRNRASHGRLLLPRRRQAKATAPAVARRKRGKEVRVNQIADFLRTRQLRYDVLSQKTQQLMPSGQWADLTDRMQNDLYMACCTQLGENLRASLFRDVLCSSVVPTVHPLRQYVLSLPEWDEGQPDYIREMLEHVSVVEEQHDLWLWAARKWFVAMVAGWLLDEVVNHEVLVLIGEQGIFKTSWIDSLMPPQLRSYCSKQNSTRFLDKDEQLRASEFGLINLDEIDNMSEPDLNALKSLVSTTDVNVRAAYGRNKERRLRVASYAASGNKTEFLTDQTGNRRWLPFHVQNIRLSRSAPLPYEGMYAQARYLIDHDFRYWFDAADIQRMTPQTHHFAVECPEEQLLPIYFQPCEPGTPGAIALTAAEISAKLTQYGNIRRPVSLQRLGRILRSHGFEQVRSSSVRRYVFIEKSVETIKAERSFNARW